MGTRITINGAERIYKAASLWVDRALRADDSLFTPGKPIWSSKWLWEVHKRFLNNQDNSGADSTEKFQRQLAGSPPEVYQLMGEALYVYFLIVTTKNSSAEQKRIDDVLGLSPQPVATPPDLAAALTPGIANPGAFFHVGRQFQVGFLIEFVEQWKEQEPDEQASLLSDPWGFKKFVTGLEFRSELLKDSPDKPSTQREALLHLVFPDTFESIVSVVDKVKIATAFSHLVTQPTEDIDRQLEQIRPALEAKYGSRNWLFYRPPVQELWENGKGEPPPVIPPVEPPSPPANWSALAEKLLWEPGQLQEIIDDLEEKGQVIFYGPPGTGKTYVAQEVAKECKRNGGGFEIVQFHPSYSYEDFVEGFRPRLIHGQPGFELVPGPLRRIAEKARNNHHATFILVIDELNRGNVSKVLGELYFLLEYRDESVRLQYGGDGEGFSLPPNLWFICTMNTADRSIALMDAALRRRFYFAPFFPDEPPVKGLLHRWLTKNGHGTWVADLVDAANKKLDRDSGIGPSYFMGDGQTLDESRVRRIWKRAVMPYIEEQCFGDSEKLKEFEFDRLKQEIDGTAPGPGNAPQDAVPSGEPAPAQANDADTNTA